MPRNDADVTVFENYIIARGRGQVSEVLSRHWVRNAQRVYAFLNNRDPGWIQGLTENSVADHSGTDLQHRTIYIGAPFNGFHPTSVVPMLLARFQRLGGTVMLGVQGLSLITGTNGIVTGAVAKRRFFLLQIDTISYLVDP